VRRLFSADVLKGVNGIVITVATLVGLLVTLGLIRPFGGETQDALASAAGATADAGSSRMTLDMSIDAGAQGELSFSGEGSFDYRTNKGEFTYDYSGTPGLEAATAIPAIVHPNTLYFNYSSLVPGLAKPWVRMTPDELAESLGASEQDVSNALTATSDPSQFLEFVKDAGEVEEAGEEQLFGVTTTRYEGELDPAKLDMPAGSTSGPLRIEVWVDESDLVRRTELSGEFTDPTVGTATLEINQELFEFGVDVDAEAPPADQVASLAEFQEQAQALGTP
jgi:hypothetical protein